MAAPMMNRMAPEREALLHQQGHQERSQTELTIDQREDGAIGDADRTDLGGGSDAPDHAGADEERQQGGTGRR